jgi:hypothetical protein
MLLLLLPRCLPRSRRRLHGRLRLLPPPLLRQAWHGCCCAAPGPPPLRCKGHANPHQRRAITIDMHTAAQLSSACSKSRKGSHLGGGGQAGGRCKVCLHGGDA